MTIDVFANDNVVRIGVDTTVQCELSPDDARDLAVKLKLAAEMVERSMSEAEVRKTVMW